MLVTFHNSSSQTKTISLRSSGLWFWKGTSVEVAPAATRHLLARFESPEVGDILMRFEAESPQDSRDVQHRPH